LIAWSADDAFFPLADAKRLAATLPNSRLEVIERVRSYVISAECIAEC